MALGDPYATVDELKRRVAISDTADDQHLENALLAASRSIEGWCQRQFNVASAASARSYNIRDAYFVEVDDISTSAGVVVAADQNDDGIYEQTWTTSDYQLEPLNGVVDGEPGWPAWRIRAVGASLRFPTIGRRPGVQVTAVWGWASVPAGVRNACLILGEEIFKLKDAPFGVAGFGEYGAVRIRENPKVQALLMRYRSSPVQVA